MPTMAEPNRALYDLQERCGKQATALFEKEWGSSGVTSNGSIASFENHYNARLNTCVMLLIWKNAKGERVSAAELLDLLSNKTLGECMVSGGKLQDCYIYGGVYGSMPEWRKAVYSGQVVAIRKIFLKI